MPYEKSTPSSPEANSGSSVQANLQALADLFPSVVRDGQVDVDALRQLCGEAVVKDDELFGLNWHGKAEARAAALTPSLGTLRPCKAESKDWDTTQNLYIEGDNLEVLKLLRKSYAGRIKMIYIDPPYNTGKEFVYPDNYQDSIGNYKELTGQTGKFAINAETSGRFHTDWLNMIFPRIGTAKKMLTEDGIFFISIGDNEVANLQNICDEIFGSCNKIGIIARVSKKGGNKGDLIKPKKDFVLVYAKNICAIDVEKFGFFTDFEEPEWLEETFKGKRRKYILGEVPYRAKLDSRPNQRYYIECPDGSFIIPPGNVFPPIAGDAELVKPISNNDKCWTWSRDRYLQEKENGRFYFYKSSKKVFLDETGNFSDWGIRKKIFHDELLDENEMLTKKEILVDFLDNYPNASGTKDISDLGIPFDFPKPCELIKYFTHIACDKNSLILDFFSGSATTAHALMQLNAEDGGSRRFIMVQLPEPCDEKTEAYKAGYKNICAIGKERIRRAGEKVKEKAGLEGRNLDIGFRVYKLDSSNVKAWNPQPEDLVDAMKSYGEHLVSGRTEDDFLTEILLKSGIDLTEEIETRNIAGHTVHSLGYGQYYACMDADLASDQEEVALGIAAWHEEETVACGGEQQDTCTVFVLDKAFGSPAPNDAAKLNFVAILEQHGICNIKAL